MRARRRGGCSRRLTHVRDDRVVSGRFGKLLEHLAAFEQPRQLAGRRRQARASGFEERALQRAMHEPDERHQHGADEQGDAGGQPPPEGVTHGRAQSIANGHFGRLLTTPGRRDHSSI